MSMDFKTFEKILSDSGWECFNIRPSIYAGTDEDAFFKGKVKFFKGELATGWVVGEKPVSGITVVDKKGQFDRSIIFRVPRGGMEANFVEWLSRVEMEYKLFGL